MTKGKQGPHQNPFYRKRPGKDQEVISYPIRLNKFVAKSGLCSRRKAAELIKEGKVSLNGKVVLEPYIMVQENDIVEHEGKRLLPETRLVYLLMNKPKGVITTTADEKDRRTVLDLVKEKESLRLFPVGRLDRNTTGLLLITNDGDLAKKLAHPSHEVKKEYAVTLDKPLSEQHFKMIENEVMLEDGPVSVKTISFADEEDRLNVQVSLVLGRNRIVRRLFEHLGYEVVRLDRIYYAGLTKKNLSRGRYRHLTAREVIMLKHFS